MSFAVLRSYDRYIPAHLAKQQLEEAGFHAFLQDENTVTIDPILTNAIGGIKLVVPPNEFEAAHHFLLQIEERFQQTLTCPVCGSHEVQYVTKQRDSANWLMAILTFMFGSYAVAPHYVYRCFQCNQEFDDAADLML